MHPTLARRLSRMEVQRAVVLGELAAWPETRLRFRPAAGAWSALEVLDHVVKTDAGIVHALEAGLATPCSVGWRDRGGRLLVHTAMLLPTRVKVPPEATMVIPEAATELGTILVNWAACRERLRECLEMVERDQLRAGVFRHPVAGWLTPAGTLGFMAVHLHHHGYQLRRLARASKLVRL